jgi:NAD(P)-dependent dehydrogenase (short-subunit alcohol dehydrogenase family)
MSNILIIGGSTGIGKVLSTNLSQNNTVYATYNKTEISDSKIHYFKYDVLDELDETNLPEIIDGYVYCPGTVMLKPFHRITEDTFIEDYKIQVVGAIKSIQKILPRLSKSTHASIVLFSTVAVQTGFNFHSLISTHKGAIEGLTKALAAEFSPKIRVNTIAPSITNTPLVASMLSTEEKIAANAIRHPLKKIGSPEDIAAMAEFLLSEKSSWMTGQILHVDGGISSIRL